MSPGLRRRRSQRIVAWSAGVALAVLFLLLLWPGARLLTGVSVERLSPGQQVAAVDAVRSRLLQLAAGVLAVGALIFTARAFYLQREAYMTDRYIRAIEQLGSASLDVRIGAIYALERIMVDSARDHATIVEVIAAFARERAPADPISWENAEPPCEVDPDSLRPPTDLRAAVTVLGRRPAGRTERGRIDLQRTDLRGIDLYQSNLADTRMTLVDMRKVFLVDVNFSGSFINNANFDGAVLVHINFRDAFLVRTSFRNAFMPTGEITYVGLPTTGTVIAQGCDLRNANLTDADLTNARIHGAQLSDACLIGANLSGADLRDTQVGGADFTEAILDGTVLKGIDLRSARGLTRRQIDAADTDETTQLPTLPEAEPGE